MALQQLDTKHESPLGKWKTMMKDEVEDNVFECNICLDMVQDPVVTLCGHLYCWPCIYKWIHFQSLPSDIPDQPQQQPQCPVCKAQVSQKTLIPLYGRAQPTAKPYQQKAASNLGIVIPQRPPSPRCGGRTMLIDSNPSQQQGVYMDSTMLTHGGTTATMLQHSAIGEVAYSRIFGNSSTTVYTYPNSYNLAGNPSPRMRRRLAQDDRSLGRICYFLFLCLIACLLLF